MRILHVLDHSAPLQSGYTFRTLSILKEQWRLGWETAQLTSAKHPATELEEQAEGVTFHRTPKRGSLSEELPVLRQLAVIRSLQRRMETLVDAFRPDIVHAHSPALNGVAAVIVARARSLPLVYELRALWEDAAVDHGTSRPGGARYRLTRGLESYVLRRADAVTTICRGLREDIVARGIPEENVTVIPNAVDVETFSVERSPDADLVRELGLAGAEVVGFIGSFYAYEGLELLLSVLPALVAERPRLRLLLVGGGPQEEYLRTKTRTLALDGKVVFAGRVPFEDVGRYYDVIDVLVYPRLPMRLTDLVTPLKPLEAMAMGKVLVASDVGGHRELIESDENGVLFRAGDAGDLSRSLSRLLDDRSLRAKLSARGREYVERERTWAKSVERYRDVYTRVLGRSHV